MNALEELNKSRYISVFASVIGLCVAQQKVIITNYTSETGSFSSPNFGSLYPANSSYRYYITEKEGSVIVKLKILTLQKDRLSSSTFTKAAWKNLSCFQYITLTFQSFAVEGYSNAPCKYDWVVVVEGDNVDDLKDCTLPPTGVLAGTKLIKFIFKF